MDLSLEAYHLIVKHVGYRADLASLCTVCKGFRRAAERALYNTVHLHGYASTVAMCNLLSATPRLSNLVVALSIYDDSNEESDDNSLPSDFPPPDDYWQSITHALHHTIRLRYLNLHFDRGTELAYAWILDGCIFQLRSFHCDLAWDEHLSSFLNTQMHLTDLYIVDFPEDTVTPAVNISPLNANTLPSLTALECTFTEAVGVIVPGRPVTHIKTCFSKTRLPEKRREMRSLFSALKRSTRAIRSLDIADSSYSHSFTLELLSSVVNTVLRTNAGDLRYLGTLALPISGRQRLRFYGMLMRLSWLQWVEVEVSDWDPAPTTPAALRALTCELRLYCPSVTRVVFVYNFDRAVMRVTDNICTLEHDANTEHLWREV